MLKFDWFYLISLRKMHAIVRDVHRRGRFSRSIGDTLHQVTGGGVIDSRGKGDAPGDFIPWSGHTHEIGSQGH
jgi:hypothetical protein